MTLVPSTLAQINCAMLANMKKAWSWLNGHWAQDEKEPVVLYNVACFYAMQGDKDRSLELLTRAVEQGWGDRAWLETDSDLDSLRADHRFTALLEGIH